MLPVARSRSCYVSRCGFLSLRLRLTCLASCVEKQRGIEASARALLRVRHRWAAHFPVGRPYSQLCDILPFHMFKLVERGGHRFVSPTHRVLCGRDRR
jgi:hypothetical protein